MEKNKKIKCVIWDLDNTIWHGILSEHDSVTLRENIGHIIKTLDNRGILQSIASKNEYRDAIGKLTEFGLDAYFLYPQINWGSKSHSVKTICEKLNISLDTIAFIDDQPFERDEVESVHPEVRCLDVSQISLLTGREDMHPRFITSESAVRRQMYLQDEQRNLEEKEMGDNNAFLEGLNMKFMIEKATVEDLNRVEELTIRTNQLNATGFTYSYEELKGFLNSPSHELFVCELEDKYGPYGKIGVALLEKSENDWYINLLLMSCRVMSRGVGTVLLNYLVNKSVKAKKKLYAKFYHTGRNRMMYITYKFAGFDISSRIDENAELLIHNGSSSNDYPHYIKLQFPANTREPG